jgi:hypothetical protein
MQESEGPSEAHRPCPCPARQDWSALHGRQLSVYARTLKTSSQACVRTIDCSGGTLSVSFTLSPGTGSSDPGGPRSAMAPAVAVQRSCVTALA